MTGWLIETGIAVTALMLLVLAVRRPVAQLFGAGWAYALWALPALRMVLPPLHLFGAELPTLLPAATAAGSPAGAIAVAVGDSAPALSWEPLLAALWIGGALLFALWHGWIYLAFMRRLGIGSQVQASLAQDVGIVASDAVDGPLAIGLLDKWIVVPADFATRYSAEEQRLALLHEHVHHRREDILWNMVALGVLALNWFNPIAYAAFRAFRADQELSCDAVVAAEASASDRLIYASALVKSASRPGMIAACPLNHAGQLKQRLRMMKLHRRSGLRAISGAAAVGAMMIAGISVTERAVAVPVAEAVEVAAKPPLPVPAPKPAIAQVAAVAAPKAAPKPKPSPRKAVAVAAEPAPAPLASIAVATAVAAPAPVAEAFPAAGRIYNVRILTRTTGGSASLSPEVRQRIQTAIHEARQRTALNSEGKVTRIHVRNSIHMGDTQ